MKNMYKKDKERTEQIGTNVKLKNKKILHSTHQDKSLNWCVMYNMHSAASVLEQSCMEIYPIHLTIGNESRFSLFIYQQWDEKISRT